MSSTDFEKKSGKGRDGYTKTTWTCKGCGKKVATISVGNGAGWRYGMALFVMPALDGHKCVKVA